MKSILFMISVLIASQTAMADGFRCEGVNTGIQIKIYNYTEYSMGTRTPAVMVVADPTVRSPNKTVAIFKHENNNLYYLGNGLFEGQVDLRYSETGRKGENIAGTKLGFLKSIQVQLFSDFGRKFSYEKADEYKNNEILDARYSYVKRNGEILEEKAVCTRYLKD
jgi:hypothetical protein